MIERFPFRRTSAAIVRARRAPMLEPLERRHLMAAWSPVASETLVNDTIAGIQETTFESHKSISSDDNGHYVVVWSGTGPGDADGIYARLYDAAGPLGASFRVNTTTAGVQAEAAVAMDNTGKFIVIWSSNGPDGSGWGVYGQRYNAAGVAQGAQFRVNTTTAGNQNQPSVASDVDGDFIVTWTSENLDGAGQGIGGQRYNASGVAQGGQFVVNGYTDGNQLLSAVAMDDAGAFTVVWQSEYLPTSSIGIFTQRFTAAGAAIGTWSVVNTTTSGFQLAPAIGMNATGAYVVAWTSDSQDGSGRGIFAQRYTSAGAKAGGEFGVNATTSGDQQYPSVAVDDTGSFAITWESFGQDQAGTWGVYARQYAASGATVGGEFRVNVATNNHQQDSAITYTGNGDAVITWNGSGIPDGAGVYTRRYADAQGIVVTPTSGLTTTEYSGTATFNVVLTGAPTGNVTISIASTDTTEGTVSVSSLTFSSSNWATPQTVTVTGWDDGTADGNVAYSIVTGTAVSNDVEYSGRIVADVAMTGLDDTVEPPAVGTEFRVNTTTANTQERPAVAMTSFGWYVVVWSSTNQDGNAKGVYAQRYGVGGVPLGPEFLVNQYTNSDQEQPAVAVDANGNFLVTWSSRFQDGSGRGVYARRFAANGTALGNEFLVNTTTADHQDQPSVAMHPSGSFVITWRSSKQDGSNGGIFAKRFDASGNALGGEFLVNTNTVDNQDQPAAASDGSGGFVIVWKSNKADGSGAGVYGRRYDSAGAALGPEFRVNTTASSNQDKPTVGMAASGAFVVAWASQDQDGDRRGVYAQRYDSAGVALGSEFLVNTITVDDQDRPTIGMSSSGAFAIAWASREQDGDGKAIWVRHYNSAGVPLGSAPVNTTVALNQDDPALAMDATGDFVVVWSGNGIGDTAGIFGQRYASPEIVITPVSGAYTTESGGAVTFGVVLNTAPTSNVVVSITTSDPTEGSVSVATLSFNPANWNVVRTVTVTGVNDALNDGDVSYSISIGPATSSDPAYSGLTAPGVQLVNVDTTPVVNAPPTLSVSAVDLPYVENDGAVAVDAGLTISDANDSTLVGAVVSIVGYVAGQDVLSYSGGGGISSVWNAGTGTLTLSGVATVGQYEAALRSVTYLNTSENPNTSARSIRFVANDGQDNSTPASRPVTVSAVNDPPMAADETYAGEQGLVLSVPAASGVLANDTDVEGGALSAVLVQQAANGTVQLFANGSFTYTPNPGFWGTDSFVYLAHDGAGDSNTATVTIQVARAAGVTITPTSGLVTSEAGASDTFSVVLDRAPTADVTINLSSSDLTEGTVSVASITFTPANWNVPQVVTVTGVNDALNDGNVAYTITTGAATSSDPAYSGLAVADVSATNVDTTPPPNVPPTISTSGTALQYVENSGAVVVDPALTVSDANDATLDSAVISIIGYVSGQDVLGYASAGSITGSWDAGTGTLTLSGVTTVAQYEAALRSVTYTNNSDTPSTAARSVRFVVNDGQASSTPASRTVTVNPMNDAPVAADESYAGEQGLVLTVPAGSGVLANDTDVDGGTPSAVLVQQAANGTVQLFADGSFTYTPNAGFWGTDSFVYSVGDGAGGSDTGIVTLHVARAAGVTITPTSGLVTAEAGGSATFSVVLDRAPTADVTINLSSSDPTEGMVSVASLTFTPANWNVPQSVTVTGVDDGVVDSDRAYAVVTAAAVSADPKYDGLDVSDVSVTNTANVPPPAGPVVAADEYRVVGGKVLAVGPGGVLGNDASPGGLTLSASLVRQVEHGVVSLAPDGGFVYTPAAGFAGTDRFTYLASDANGVAPGEVTIVVEPAPAPTDPPVVVPVPRPPLSQPEIENDADDAPVEQEEPPVIVVTAPPPMPAPPELTPTLGGPSPEARPAHPGGPVAPTPVAVAPPPMRLVQRQAANGRREDGSEQEDVVRGDNDPGRVPTVRGTFATPVAAVNAVPAAAMVTAVGPLATKLDAMARQLGAADSQHNVTVRTVSQVALAMTAGYVMWSLRGASMLASLLTSLPLWRSLDPLPILEARADRDRAKAAAKRRKKAKRKGGPGEPGEPGDPDGKGNADDKLGSIIN